MSRMRSRSRPRGDDGQALVELAIVLVILLALVIGIFEFGRAWNIRQTITNAAREGARLAVLQTSTEDQVVTTVNTYLTAAGLDPATGVIAITGIGAGVGTPTTVQVDYPYAFTFLGPIVDLLADGGAGVPAGTVTISATAIMRNE